VSFNILKIMIEIVAKKIVMNSFETQCIHGCKIVNFLKFGGHQAKFIPCTKLGKVLN
jgi:hypothetical protein